ncbi:hypothetical protein C8F04DRAFT_1189352 [Mycena alexandri]|uniref:Uncharacterized protein n=1 Tax=Mycena alexandri TaxID=1745969 RepID=A0AAD6WY45_9AGAR|nr:hypothetical protein C8F04DRAFT_1189352 [Mycena alexandri]
MAGKTRDGLLAGAIATAGIMKAAITGGDRAVAPREPEEFRIEYIAKLLSHPTAGGDTRHARQRQAQARRRSGGRSGRTTPGGPAVGGQCGNRRVMAGPPGVQRLDDPRRRWRLVGGAALATATLAVRTDVTCVTSVTAVREVPRADGIRRRGTAREVPTTSHGARGTLGTLGCKVRPGERYGEVLPQGQVVPPPLPPAQPTMADMDDPMPAPSGSQEDPFEPSYLGRSPPSTRGDPSDASSASASLTVALDAASRRSPRLWAPGARTITGEWPAATDAPGTRMLPNDARAIRFVNYIAPMGEGTSPDRTRFIEVLLRGFSIFGLFERHVQRGQWVEDALPLEHYPFDCSDLTLSRVFSWAHQHGLRPNSPDSLALHSYAASERNRLAKNESPGGQRFVRAKPRDVADVLSWPDGLITDWRQLQHGPIRRGVTTTYPQHPAAAAFAASAANIAPMPSIAPQPVTADPPPASNPAPLAPDVDMKPVEDGEIPEEGTPENGGALITHETRAPEGGPSTPKTQLNAADIPLPEDDDDWETVYEEGAIQKPKGENGTPK